MLDAFIAAGPNKGLTLRECIAFVLVTTGDEAADVKRAADAKAILTAAKTK